MKTNLQKRYEKVVTEYIQIFSDKQELEFEYWIGDIKGGVACFSEIYFYNFQDIVWDINSKQSEGLIKKWFNDSIDNHEKAINYFSYSKGLRFDDIS